MTKICILDYGSGNVRSVFNAFSTFADPIISNSVKDIRNSSHLILPGVGSFAGAMANIRSKIDIDELKKQIALGKLFLGICVGMQVLATIGHEFEKTNGLGLIEGEVVSMDSHGESLPHVGWNSVRQQRTSELFNGIPDNKDFYFVHSYKFQKQDQKQSSELGLTSYGQDFISVINEQNIFGVQFHPEKSQSHGLNLLRNFSRIQ